MTLSTPSLRITAGVLKKAGIDVSQTFNSLSRDHKFRGGADEVMGEIAAFNSLSRDHRTEMANIFNKMRELSTPSLGITSILLIEVLDDE